MGYRSDVAIVLRSNVIDKFNEAKGNLSREEEYWVDALINSAYDNAVSNGDWLLVWQWIKWYESEPYIEFFMDFIESLSIDDYYYCRVGEDLTDTEIEGFYYDNPFGLELIRRLDYTALP